MFKKSQLLTIKEAAEILGITKQTLRRWDKGGKLPSIRGKNNNYRYYPKEIVQDYIDKQKNISGIVKDWAIKKQGVKPHSDFYCPDISVFSSRLGRLETELSRIKKIKKIFPLIVAIAGEIGNNSFDHNLGNWPDISGVFFAYDKKKGLVVLADRGQGILATLKRVRPKLNDHQEALYVAFTEIISGRAPESRGNGLKFVKEVVANNKIELFFQTGDAHLIINRVDSKLDVKTSNDQIQGCFAEIKF